ncbi:hypothetical protein [Saccharibacillus kuerlensis]|uniref:Copper amine oxidase-like N-terminal domain-containing protein n=1 Tax=Saccharibacillus kuerlensis TaxID=459527 RepID=A0ABQ2L4R9_9BACL|nr:hypothetical protein [Saccharibacillus kuerlensis]GGO03355.1 hypothetical protein GCM10010969_27530 [Saccharibacillus kuerlensis]
MKKWLGKKPFILLLALIVFTSMTMPVNAEPKSKSGKAVIQVGKKKTYVNIKVAHGITYVPIKSLAAAVGSNVVYYQDYGMDVYDVYEVRSSKAIATYLGNDYLGYDIFTRKKGYERNPELDKSLYHASWNCEPESDNCWLDEAKDTGPFLSGKTLYVPLRLSAKALEMKLTVGRDSSGKPLYTLK